MKFSFQWFLKSRSDVSVVNKYMRRGMYCFNGPEIMSISTLSSFQFANEKWTHTLNLRIRSQEAEKYAVDLRPTSIVSIGGSMVYIATP